MAEQQRKYNRKRVNFGRAKDRPVTPKVECAVTKDFDSLGLEIKRAFLNSNTAAEAHGKIMVIVKANFNGYIEKLIDGPKETLLNRILELKSQING